MDFPPLNRGGLLGGGGLFERGLNRGFTVSLVHDSQKRSTVNLNSLKCAIDQF